MLFAIGIGLSLELLWQITRRTAVLLWPLIKLYGLTGFRLLEHWDDLQQERLMARPVTYNRWPWYRNRLWFRTKHFSIRVC